MDVQQTNLKKSKTSQHDNRKTQVIAVATQTRLSSLKLANRHML